MAKQLSFAHTVKKIADECNRRGMKPPYTLRFTTADGKELEVVKSDDLRDIGEIKSPTEAVTITVTVQDQGGRVIAGTIQPVAKQ